MFRSGSFVLTTVAATFVGWLLSHVESGCLASEEEYRVVDDPAVQKMRVSCGPNALYMFLRAHGVQARYEVIAAGLPMQTAGCTMLALKETAANLGLKTRVVKSDRSRIKYLRLPAILHFHNSVFFGDNVQHYVLLTKVTDDGITYIDGTSGLIESITLKKLQAVSDGYALEVDNGTRFFGIAGVIPALVLLAVFLLKTTKIKHRTTSGLKQAVISCCFLTTSSGCAAESISQLDDSDSLSPSQVWRSSENDALNALELYFRIQGKNICRETIKSVLPFGQLSLADLSSASTRLGVPQIAVRPMLKDLEKMPIPVIVHLHDDKEEHGGYFVLFRLSESRVDLVNASTVAIESMNIDEFRHKWSGFALERSESSVHSVRHIGIAVVGLASYLFLRQSIRGVVQKNNKNTSI